MWGSEVSMEQDQDRRPVAAPARPERRAWQAPVLKVGEIGLVTSDIGGRAFDATRHGKGS